jgi:trans-2,3-dihydro-3-hydroxyanthranilate isomerase
MYRVKEISKSKSMIFALYILFSACYTTCMYIPAHLVKVFTKDMHLGNPAGVILDAENLTYVQMAEIARHLGCSESVFVSSSNKAQFRFRYFSPTCEVDACAHATIAAIHVINPHDTITYETNLGVFEAFKDKDGRISIPQGHSSYLKTIPKDEIANALQVSRDLLECENHKVPWVVSTGVPKLLVPIQTLKDLHYLKPNFDAIEDLCRRIGAKGVYVYTLQTRDPKNTAHTRQFNPLCGINEDPVTGTAAAALGAYFYLRDGQDAVYRIEQGDCMDKPGTVEVQVYKQGMYDCRVLVCGYAVEFGTVNLCCELVVIAAEWRLKIETTDFPKEQ